LLSNFCVKIFSQNSLISIQILNGFFIFYCATWGGLIPLNIGWINGSILES
jgi:hypothetical protein